MDFYFQLLLFCGVVWFCAKLWQGRNGRPGLGKRSAVDGTSMVVRSFSDPSIAYRINPADARCECPDWTDSRGAYSTSDPRRMCKHLVRAFHEAPHTFPVGMQRYADDFNMLANHGKGFPSHAEQHRLSVAGRELECWTNGSPWVAVYIGTQRHAFSMDEGRWAFGKEPQGAEEIEPLLMDRFA